MLNLLARNASTWSLLVVLSIPLILRWIKPNAGYGFRVKATLNTRGLCDTVDSYPGWRMVAGDLSAIVSGAGLHFVPNVTLHRYSLGRPVSTGIALVAGDARTVPYLRAPSRK